MISSCSIMLSLWLRCRDSYDTATNTATVMITALATTIRAYAKFNLVTFNRILQGLFVFRHVFSFWPFLSRRYRETGLKSKPDGKWTKNKFENRCNKKMKIERGRAFPPDDIGPFWMDKKTYFGPKSKLWLSTWLLQCKSCKSPMGTLFRRNLWSIF